MTIAYHVRFDWGFGRPVMDAHVVKRELPGELWLRHWGSPITGDRIAEYTPTKEAAVEAYVASCESELRMRESQIASLRERIFQAKLLDGPSTKIVVDAATGKLEIK